MDLTTVYSKTAKGVQAITQKGKRLPSKLLRALSLVDGRATVEEILEKARELPSSALPQTLADLARDGYLKTVAREPLTRFSIAPDASASMVVSETVDETFFKVLAETEIRKRRMKEAAENLQEVRQKDREATAAAVEEEATRRRIAAQEAADAEQRSRQEAVRRKIAEVMAQEEAAIKARRQADIQAHQEKVEKIEKEMAEAKERALREAQEKAAKEAASRAAAELRARKEAEARARQEAEARKNREDAEKSRREEEARAHEEVERKAREEAEQRALQEAAQQKAAAAQAREEAQRKAREEADIQALQEKADKEQAATEEQMRRETQEKAAKEVASRTAAELRAKVDEKERARQEAEQRKIAEAKVQEETERKAREEADSQALREKSEKEQAATEERMHREAQAKAAAEAAERKAQEEAERSQARERKIAEAEAKAKAEAEELARAEARRQIRLEARAREEAERKQAREEAEAKAKAEAEERKRLEAEAEYRTRLEEEEKSRAEEAARIQAEADARAREEAQRKAREEAEAQARRAAEARAILEAEEKARAEEAARAKAEADARALEDAQRKAREEAEAREIAEAEERAHREAEEKIRAQEEALAKARAQEERMAREEAEQEKRERAEIEARARALADARAAEAAKDQQKARAKAKKPRHPVKWGKAALISLAALILLPLALLQVMSLDLFIPPIEKLATERMREPVSIHSLRASLWPAPHLRLEGVAIGKLRDIKIPVVRVTPELATFFGATKTIKAIEAESLTIDQDALARAIAWVAQGGAAGEIQIRRVVLKTATIDFKGLPLPPLAADVALTATGQFEQANIRSADKKIELSISPKNDGFEVDIAANNWQPPLWPNLTFSELRAKAMATPEGMRISEIEGRIYGGKAQGSATVQWGDSWQAEGDFIIENVLLGDAMPALTNDIALTGKLDAKAVYSMQSEDLGTLFDNPRIKASFNIRDGAIGNIDLARAIQPQAAATTGGKTLFAGLSGSMTLAGNRYQYRQMKLAAGLLSASGEADIMPNRQLTGKTSVEMKLPSSTVRARLTLSGDLKQPVLRR